MNCCMFNIPNPYNKYGIINENVPKIYGKTAEMLMFEGRHDLEKRVNYIYQHQPYDDLSYMCILGQNVKKTAHLSPLEGHYWSCSGRLKNNRLQGLTRTWNHSIWFLIKTYSISPKFKMLATILNLKKFRGIISSVSSDHRVQNFSKSLHL